MKPFIAKAGMFSLSILLSPLGASIAYAAPGVSISPSTIYGVDGDTVYVRAGARDFDSVSMRWSMYGQSSAIVGSTFGNSVRVKLNVLLNNSHLYVDASGTDDEGASANASDFATFRVRPNPAQMTQRTAYVNQLYRRMLGRVPGASELTQWKDGLDNYSAQSCADVAGEFLGSSEFKNLSVGLRADEYVRRLYRGVLNRDPDEPTFSIIVGRLRAGRLTRHNYAADFLKSKELEELCKTKYGFRERGNGRIASTIPDPVIPELIADRRTAYLKRLYKYLLGREADASGLAYWQSVVNKPNGPSCAQTAVKFLMSPEFLARNRASTIRQFVSYLYRPLMNRAPDAGGLTYWATSGQTRQYITRSFLGSPEYDDLCRTKYGFTGAGTYSGLAIPGK